LLSVVVLVVAVVASAVATLKKIYQELVKKMVYFYMDVTVISGSY